jgi:HSP20 family protein
MAKQKKSFFEKITGVKDDGTGQVPPSSHQGIYQEEEPPYFPQAEGGTGYDFPEEEEVMGYEEGYEEQDEIEDYGQPQTSTPPVNQPDYPPHPHHPNVPVDDPGDQEVESEGQLTIDVYQTEDYIVIKSTIAGVKPEDLDVNINNDMVTIRGERKQDEPIDPENYYYQECYWGPFSRSIILPVEIIAEKAEATMKNGILTIRLLKADTKKTRKLQVKGY